VVDVGDGIADVGDLDRVDCVERVDCVDDDSAAERARVPAPSEHAPSTTTSSTTPMSDEVARVP
jgi:hypothetical protein